MWRVLVVAALVSALGAFAVEAGRFSVTAEDVNAYETVTSLTIPCPPQVLTGSHWVRGPETLQMGILDPVAPLDPDDPPPFREVENSIFDVRDQTDPDEYVTWATPPAPPCGYRINARVTLLIDADGRRSDRLTAGLFSCPVSAHPRTTTPSCRYLTSDQADRVDEDDERDEDDFLVRTVDFDDRVNTFIPFGEQLRLKVVNQRGGPIFGGGSTRDWDLKWGYRDDRKSHLVITP